MDWTKYLLSNHQLIQVICDIFTAIGTFGAVAISLFFSYRSGHPKPKIKAKADFTYFHNEGDIPDQNGIPVISVIIANTNIMPIEINSFGWTFGFYTRFINKKVSYQLNEGLVTNMNPRLPILIHFGQNIQLFVTETDFKGKVQELFPKTSRNPILNKIRSFFTYLFIQDGIDNFFYVRVNKKLRLKVLEYLNSEKN